MRGSLVQLAVLLPRGHRPPKVLNPPTDVKGGEREVARYTPDALRRAQWALYMRKHGMEQVLSWVGIV